MACLTLRIGIIGATVMPHNLYLHSALVQSRKLQKDEPPSAAPIRFNTIDATMALTIAFFVNAGHLGAGGHGLFRQIERDASPVADVIQFNDDTDWIRIAYLTLAPLLGVAAASPLFAIALLASGQAAPSPARWRARSSWKGSCTGGCSRGFAGSSPDAGDHPRRFWSSAYAATAASMTC